MSQGKEKRGLWSVESEYEGAELGDPRRNKRLLQIVQGLQADPSRSFPEAAGRESALEATYRFFAQEALTKEALLSPHVEHTLSRCHGQSQIIVAHDTTEFNFGKTPREDLGQVGRGKSFGFYGHFALAVHADEWRDPLGILGFLTHERTGDKGRRGHAALQEAPNNEGRRWKKLIHQVQALTSGETSFLHVMDREADSYALMAELSESNTRFVIRMGQETRKLSQGGPRIKEALQGLCLKAQREVNLSGRKPSLMPSTRRMYPERKARIAQLCITATKVHVKRPHSASQTAQAVLPLHVVHVFEETPPPGEPAVTWRLWTQEPIETEQQVLFLVDAYRARWRIEEFFKALKTGCAVEKRQLETTHSLCNAIAVFIPMAVQLLRLRLLSQQEPTAPATQVLSPKQLFCLHHALLQRKRPGLSEVPTVQQALLGIAALGGHLHRNGDPGWIVLGRGLEHLLTLEQGFLFASQTCVVS